MLENPGPLDPTNTRMTTADGRQIVVHGATELSVCFCGCKLPLRVTVVDMQPEAILGMDALCHWKASVNTSRGEIDVEDGTNVQADRPAACLRIRFRPPLKDASYDGLRGSALEEDSTLAGGEWVQGRVRGKVIGITGERVVNNEDCSTVGTREFQAELEMNAGTETDYASRDVAKSYDDVDTKDFLKCSQHREGESCNLHGIGAGQDHQKCCYAELTRDIKVPGRSTVLLPVELDGNHTDKDQLFEGIANFTLKSGLLVGRTWVPRKQTVAAIEVTNTGQKEVHLYRHTKIAKGSQLDARQSLDLCQPTEAEVHMVKALGDPEDLSWIDDVVQAMPKEATPEEIDKVREMLLRRRGAFQCGPEDTGGTDVVTHRIDTGDNPPIRQRFRRIPPERRKVVEDEIAKMLERGVIEPGNGPWASPIVLVQKKSGEWRFCIDYRKLNDITKKDAYPLPRIDDTLDMLGGARYFATVDLASGYWQVAMDEADREKTAVCTHQGLYQFKRMPFGLCNAPSTFERLMDVVLRGLVGLQCLVYLDDVIVFGATITECCDRLEEVLTRLESAGLKVKGTKCQLFQTEVEYLGHVVSAAGVATDPKKVEAVRDWSRPRCVKEIRSYLGFCSYYRNYIQGFAQVASPLTRLLEKGIEFEWSPECEDAFNQLKSALLSAPILGYPRPEGALIVDTDASDVGLGAVLSQVQDGQERVLCYASRTLTRPERNYCVTRRELLAVIFAVRKFKAYLGGQVKLRTDHHALRWLLNFKEPEGQVARWMEELAAYNLEIEHRPGRRHGNADGLSRQECKQCGRRGDHLPEVEDKVCMVLVSALNDTMSLKEAQAQDPVIQEVTVAVQERRALNPNEACGPGDGQRLRKEMERLTVKAGVLGREYVTQEGRTQWQAYVPHKLRQAIFAEVHAGVVGGHLGVEKTGTRLKEKFFWPGMNTDVNLWCAACETCQRRKPPPRKKRSAMQIMVPDIPWARVAVDMLGPLPRTARRSRYVLVVADYFTKWTEAFPMENGEAVTVAEILVREIVCRYGAPRILHSDQGRNFEAEVMQHLCQLLGMQKTRTTPFHPQADGMVERFNRTLEAMLASVVQEDQLDWDLQIPFVMSAYRASRHASTGFSPNFLMMGREVTLPVEIMYGRPVAEVCGDQNEAAYVTEIRNRLHQAYQTAYSRLGTTAERQKSYHDRGVQPKSYPIGSKVWMFHPLKKQGLSPKLQSFWTARIRTEQNEDELTAAPEPQTEGSGQRREGSVEVHLEGRGLLPTGGRYSLRCQRH